MNTRMIDTKHSWLKLEPLSTHDWLVIDSDEARFNEHGVIGHVQMLFGMYEAITLADPSGRQFFDSLDAAVDSFAPWPTYVGPAAPEKPGRQRTGQ